MSYINIFVFILYYDISAIELRYNEPCSHPENAILCEDGCGQDYFDCERKCHDQGCNNECKRVAGLCLDTCPCHPGCSQGCIGCDNWSCEICAVPDSDPQHIQVV